MKRWFFRQRTQFNQSDVLAPLIWGTGVALGLQTSGAILTYSSQVLLGRWLGAAQYGVYDYLITIGTFLGFIASLGLPNALLRFIPEYTVKQDWGRLRGIVWGSWRYVLTSSVVVATIGILLIIGTHYYRNQTDILPPVSLLLGMGIIPLLALIRHQLQMARGMKRIALAYLPSSLIFPMLVIAGAFYYRTTITSARAIAITFICLLVVLLIQLWLFCRRLPPECLAANPVYSRKEWFAVSLPLLLVDGAFVILSQTDILMIGAVLDSSAVGLYSAALKTASWVNFLLAAVNAIAAPMFATLYAQGDYEKLQKLVAVTARWLFFPSLLVAIGLIVFAKFTLGLFGSEFLAARGEMTILILGQLVNVGAGSVGYLMEMTGHHRQCAYVFCCSALLNVFLNTVLIPMLGISGAAIATAITMALWNIWLHQLVVKHIGVRPSIISALR